MQDDQQPPAAPQQDAGWQFTGDPASAAEQPVASSEAVSWTASEFIAHAKSAGWYFILLVSASAAAGLAYVLTQGEIFTPAIIVIVAILFGIMAARKPRELPYHIDSTGVYVGEKGYSFSNFKSFSIVQEEGVESIWLLPLQRFSPGLSIYFSPDDREKILAILDGYLPVEEKELDFVDQLMHKLRF